MSGARECGVCWWVYDPGVGDDEAQIPPGVAFEELPATYTCPRCDAPKERFVRPESHETQPAPTDGVYARDQLVASYRAIERSMRDLPIVNPRLTVEAVGARRLGDAVAFALITPWFLNVVVIGRELPPAGASVDVAFPSGTFSAMGASPTDGPAHLSISLMSPVHELADQAAARAVAEESLRLMFDSEAAPKKVGPPNEATSPKVISRRGLLGGLLPEGR